jgi:hypothetical protein
LCQREYQPLELLKGARRSTVRSAKDEVVVIAQQRIGDQPQLEPFEEQSEPVQKGRSFVGAQEQVARIASMRGEVVDPVDEGAWRPGHASSLSACSPSTPELNRFVTALVQIAP